MTVPDSEYQLALDYIDELQQQRDALLAALTPSVETKVEHIGSHETAGCYDCRSVTVSWTTIKEIMKAIRAQAEAIRKLPLTARR